VKEVSFPTIARSSLIVNPSFLAIASSMQMIVDDITGPKEILALLFTIPTDILISIITGDIGHRMQTEITERNLRYLLYHLDNTPGTYLVTFVVEGRSQGMTTTEWRNVRDVMAR
jgi:hypothetical protein